MGAPVKVTRGTDVVGLYREPSHTSSVSQRFLMLRIWVILQISVVSGVSPPYPPGLVEIGKICQKNVDFGGSQPRIYPPFVPSNLSYFFRNSAIKLGNFQSRKSRFFTIWLSHAAPKANLGSEMGIVTNLL